MKFSTIIIASFLGTATAFAPNAIPAIVTSRTTSLQAQSNEADETTTIETRRSSITKMATSAMAILSLSSQSASASLLDEFGSDPSKIQQEPTRPATNKPATAEAKAESTIEPNLRSNYYYPTNKKRYLPRIKKCNDAIPLVADAIGNGDWEAVDDFVNKVADDTILPMKLYTSSLTGGGTNVKVSFTKDMMNSADSFEKAQKALSKAVKKRDTNAASTALEQLATSLLDYRTSGKLLGPDGGGDIPSVDDIRRSACRVQGRTFEQRVKDRDARLAAVQ